MNTKFQKGDRVRHKDGLITMTVINYVMQKKYTEPLSMIGGPRKYVMEPTKYVQCQWFDQQSNSNQFAQFHQNDLFNEDD